MFYSVLLFFIQWPGPARHMPLFFIQWPYFLFSGLIFYSVASARYFLFSGLIFFSVACLSREQPAAAGTTAAPVSRVEGC